VSDPAPSMTQAQLNNALDELRARGVKSYKDIAGGGFEVEFFEPQAAPSAKAAAKPVDDNCRCGHHKDDEHQSGLCMRGCDPLTCSPAPEPKT
jgi:hypothetical protein